MSYLQSIEHFDRNRQLIELCLDRKMLEAWNRCLRNPSLNYCITYFIYQGDVDAEMSRYNFVLMRINLSPSMREWIKIWRHGDKLRFEMTCNYGGMIYQSNMVEG